MKIKKGFTLRNVGGEMIVVGEGLEQVNFNKIIVMNDSAIYLWNSLIDKNFKEEDAAMLLTQRYNVSKEKAYKDVVVLFNVWKNAGILE